MLGYQQTIISQYASSPTLRQLIANLNTCIDPRADIDAFFEQVWNIEAATGYGLDVWGRIVGVSRVLEVASGIYLGFAEADDATSEAPFNQAPFYSGAATTGNFSLTDDAYRQLILAKAALNITDCSIPSINAILMMLFGSEGECWCTDGLNMTMTYTFNFALTPLDFAIISQSGVLPKPIGVSVTVVQP